MTSEAPRVTELLRRRALTRLVDGRLRIAPAVVLLASALTALDPSPLRLALFGGAAVALVVLALAERRLLDPSSDRLALSVMLTGLIQLTVIFAAGGLAGPLVPGMMLVALLGTVLLRPGEAGAFVFAVQLPAVWLFATVHRLGWLPGLHIAAWDGLYAAPGSDGSGPWIAATVLSLMLVGAYVLGRVLRGMIDELVGEMADERRANLEIHLEASRTFGALSAEIAHELKNPLASIKGLAALVQKDLSGPSAERMEVLRREVDRMQSILDEFLAHSRPLVPLALEPTELVGLAEDVVRLHEGLAAERGVRLALRPGLPTPVRCDPRKVRQVIVNLLQNALEATPSGGAVQVAVRAVAEGAAIVIDDEGTGLAPSIAERLFEVGATSKPTGTGLGLVVSRGLARQHGGDVTLDARPEGGARATLTLPSAPPKSALGA